jgi:hypothetical protein
MKKILCIIVIMMVVSSAQNNGDWTVLFDGEKTYGLRGYKQSDFPWDSWAIENGTLKTIPPRGVDLISEDVYKNFELELEWKVSTGGNSGIFYFATEEADRIWQSAPEMQVLDDDAHQDGKRKMTSAGALYDLIPPSAKVVKPVGEFNQVRIIVQDNHVEHWLNGTKVVEYEYGSEALIKLIAKSKFKDMPYFAKANEGHIGLQHHGEEVWYRNVRIRKL